ncbi:MAG: VOC family protein, partial [Gammaproteobacteria bacterium]
MKAPPKFCSQITFLYYNDLASAQTFYEDVLGLERVEDQGWATIHRVASGAFVGLVDERKGSLKAKEGSAVLITLIVDDVRGWHEFLEARGVKIVGEPAVNEEIQVEHC